MREFDRRLTAWLSAGVLIAGVGAGTLLGAGLAFADDDEASGDPHTRSRLPLTRKKIRPTTRRRNRRNPIPTR